MGKRTRRYICTTCLELLNEKPLNKITVKDLVARCEINRNTFYYHYHDIYDVLEDIFQYEKDVFLKKQNDNTSFYDAFLLAVEPFWGYRKAINNMLQTSNYKIVQKYLDSLIKDFVKIHVKKRTISIYLSDFSMEYITHFYSSTIYSNLMRWIESGMKKDDIIMIRQLSDSFDLTIDILINQCLNHKYD